MKMEVNFDLLNREFADSLRKAFEAQDLEILEQKIKTHGRNDTDWKQALDQAFRELLLELLRQRVSVDELKCFVEFCIQSCRKSLNTPTMPVVLLGDTFESLTLDNCEEMFSFVETNVDVWKEELFFTGCKNNLLRLCNDLLRRLSRSTATVFCGKILLFLAKFFPFSERSGLNIVSEFNLENITEYGRDPDDMDIQTEIPSSVDEHKNIVIDFTFYSKFWQLQDFFRNPNQCYNKVQWKQFCAHSATILNTFQGIKIDYVTSERNVAYFPKYLTSQKLLDLQLYDVNFRRSVLLQFLIVFQYLTSSVKFKSDAYELKSDQKDWIQTHTDKVYSLLKETPPDGENFSRITQQLMSREQLWNGWKNDGCPEIKRPTPSETDVKTTESSNRPLLGDTIREAQSQGKYYLGSGELTKLWNFCPNNLEACKAKDRDFLPSLEDYFADAIEQVEAGAEAGEASLLKDSNFGWRALRLLARRSPHFFTYSQNIIHPLSHYLDMMVRKTAHERPGRANELKDYGQNGNEIDETILTEEEQNTEELKQTDGDEFVDDQNIRRFERKQLTDEQLDLFSDKLGNDWPRLALKVGYKEDEIEFLKKGHQSVFEQARSWLKLYFDDDEDATLDNFLYILEGLEMEEVAEVVRQEINSES